jgi:NAD(P)-dependent dehydrogenase (short-subunit alcohol dehydrogenase family)
LKVVAISGGGQGIGRAVALHCAKADYGVSIADTDREAGQELAGQNLIIDGGMTVKMIYEE